MIKRGIQIFLGVFFLVAGSLHFFQDDAFAAIVPPALPFPYFIVWVTGLMEIGFAVMLLTKRALPSVGVLLALFLLAVLPANIYMAIAKIPLGDTEVSAFALWVRVALQFPLIGLVLWCCEAWPFRAQAAA